MLDYDAAIKEVDILIKETRNSSTMIALKKVKLLLIGEETEIAIENIRKNKIPKLKKLNPKALRKGLKVLVIRGKNQGYMGKVMDWETPNKEYPNYNIKVKVDKTLSYLGLGDIRLV